MDVPPLLSCGVPEDANHRYWHHTSCIVQGPTSSGKTSLVAFLAAQTGHTLVRINNHEQTDLHEYLGSYISNETGKLVFREGALVQAVRLVNFVLLLDLMVATCLFL